MYVVPCEINSNAEPWMVPLQKRKSRLLRAKKMGKKCALILYSAPDTSTFRYRCYNVMQALEESQEWDAVYFFLDEMETILTLLPRIDVFVLSRVKWSHALEHAVMEAHRLGLQVSYDVDDLICDLRQLKLVTNTLGVPFPGEVHYDFWFAYIARLEAAAALCDSFIATNPFLGDRLQERFGKPYTIIRNSLNREQLEVSRRCVKYKESTQRKKPFTIGYFSGTPSHINDFKTVAQELTQLLKDHPEMQLRVVGFMEFPPYMQQLIQEKRVTFTPLVNFMELQRLISEVDVNIVPLIQNKFTNCKSELKFFEAAVVKTVTLASPIYTYKTAIQHGETGFLCDPGQWYERIVELYHDPDMEKRIVEKAYQYCLSHYSGEELRKEIETSYNFLSSICPG